MAMQRPATAWKGQVVGHWQCDLGNCSTVREAKRSRLQSSGVNVPLGPGETPLLGSQRVRGKCCRRGRGLHKDGAAREKMIQPIFVGPSVHL